ncbi:uncharacterized protein LOC112638400 [Camponotus floridanus]|uniref:uncharacterized protein LOC112638400 n=1 Tax=Camponotus floridanus TaxID=104421 RepID=UPI000DC686B4|nr:uncharacterized protein LOC112638400 [Camponotus floridanus]
MDFQNVNLLNVRLNMFSGNLLPMTSNDLLFPKTWRIYSVVISLIDLFYISAIISGFILVLKYESIENTVQDGVTISLVVTIEDETMKYIVHSTLDPMKIPLQFYCIGGGGSVIMWCCIPFALISKKTYFFYNDFTTIAAFSKQPFSTKIFLLGVLIESIASGYIFIKKVALDVYMINLILLTTAQYRYIAIKLAKIFRNDTSPIQHNKSQKEHYSNANLSSEKEMKILYQHYEAVIQIMLLLKKCLSSNVSMIYLISVFLFCFIDVLLVQAILSKAFFTIFLFIIYLCGSLTRLYILCLCIHQLLDASREVTDKAFHEKWYQFGPSAKHMFMLMIISINWKFVFNAWKL